MNITTLEQHRQPYFNAVELKEVIEAGGRLIKNFPHGFVYNGAKYSAGLYLFEVDESQTLLTPFFLCSALSVVAKTIDQSGISGVLVSFTRSDTHEQEAIIIPRGELVATWNNTVVKTLANRGLKATRDGKRQKEIINYIAHAEPRELRRYTNKTGWSEDGDSFIFPDETLGVGGMYFCNGTHNPYKTAGTLDQWSETIGVLSAGNPILQIAIMGGLAGVLLRQANIDGGGIHIFGNSSKGKSTALKVACSIWGSYKLYAHSWNATGNGIEEYSKAHNDTLLALDELQNSNARTAGAIVYNILNGTAKMRACINRGEVGIAKTDRWHVFALSTGENDIGGFLEESKAGAVKAGQTVRFIEINISTRNIGVFDDTKGQLPEYFAGQLEEHAGAYYGTAGRAFVEYLIKHKPNIKTMLNQSIDDLQLTDFSQEERRAGKLLALLNVAGDIAIKAGLVKWRENEPLEAVKMAFKEWQQLRGVNGLLLADIQTLKGYINYITTNRHLIVNNSIKAEIDTPSHAIKGWYIDTHEGREYLFTPEQMQAINTGTKLATICNAFKNINALNHDKGKLTVKRSLAYMTPKGQERERVYSVRDRVVRDFIDKHRD